MPVIGKFKTSGTIDGRVTGTRIDTRGAGAIGKALERVGNIGVETAMQIQNTLKKEEALNYGDSNATLYRKALREKELELKNTYSGTDHKGYSQDLEEFATSEMGILMEGAPSDDAKRYLQGKISGASERAILGGAKYELKSSNLHTKQLVTEEANITRDYFFNNPTVDNESELLERVTDIGLREGQSFTPQETEKLTSNLIKKAREGQFSGIEQSGNFESGLEILSREDSIFTSDMKPSEKVSWTKRFEAGIKKRENQKVTGIKSGLSTVINSIENGVPVTSDTIDSYKGQIATIKDANTRDVMLSKLGESEIYSKLAEATSLVPPKDLDIDSNIDSLVADYAIDNPDIAKLLDAKVGNKLKSNYATMMKKIQAKPADHFTQADRKLGADAVMAAQGDPEAYARFKDGYSTYVKDWDLSPSKVNDVPTVFKETFGDGVKDALDQKDSKAATALLDRMESMTQGDSYSMLRRMGINEDMAVIGEIGQGTGRIGQRNRARAVDNFIRKKDIKEQYNLNVTEDVEDDSQIANKLMENPIYASYSKMDGGGVVARSGATAVLGAVALEYKRQRADGVSPEDAQERAWDMFGSSMNTYSGNSSMAYPKKYNQDKVNNYLDASTAKGRDFVKDFDLKIEDVETAEDKNLSTYFWLPTSDGKGAELYSNRNSQDKPVFNNSNKHVYKSFEEMESSGEVYRGDRRKSTGVRLGQAYVDSIYGRR